MSFWNWEGNAAGAGFMVLPKGAITTVISANITATLTADVTYTSSATSFAGYNSVLIETYCLTAGRTIKTLVSGAMSSGGTLVDLISKDTSAQMTVVATANKTVYFTGIPDYLGFSTTLSAGMTAGSSVTVKVQPLNL
jgi:hypothetical protein